MTPATPPIWLYRLTHADDAPLPTLNPAYGTPVIASGTLALQRGRDLGMSRDTDGICFWGFEDAGGGLLLGSQCEFLEVAEGHYTLPAAHRSAEPPTWRAEVTGTTLHLVRRPHAIARAERDDAPSGEPWWLARIRSFRYERAPDPDEWPGFTVSGFHVLAPRGDEGAA